MKEIASRLGENLLRCRQRVDLSQEEIAFRASLHRTEISQLERGLRVPRIDTLLRLMGALEASAEELLEGIAWMPRQSYLGEFEIKAPEFSAPKRP
jgi:transcriptional regulator with XRE-family HTH domain